MNTDQINSLVRTALKFVGGFLIAHGLTKAASAVGAINTPDVIGLVLTAAGAVWSHIDNSSTVSGTATTPPQKQP